MSEQQPLRNTFDAATASPGEAGDDIWREEIHARLDHYRTRRGRRVEGAYSMRFPFPPPEESAAPELDASFTDVALDVPPRLDLTIAELRGLESAAPEIVESAMPEFAQEQVAAVVEALAAADAPSVAESVTEVPAETAQEPAIDMAAPVAPRPHTRRKVIAFPRHLMATPDVAYRLADPVVPEQPRILDVPEELEAVHTTPFLDGLTFDGKVVQPTQADQVELPFRPAPVGRRAYAVAIDALLVGAGCAIFASAAYKLMPPIVAGKSTLLAAAAIPVLLWFVYQFLLVVYGGRTPGMRLARVRLLTFTGKTPAIRQRRNRVIGLCLATASLAMGLLWAFVDVDALCWHDRMSQTYLTSL